MLGRVADAPRMSNLANVAAVLSGVVTSAVGSLDRRMPVEKTESGDCEPE